MSNTPPTTRREMVPDTVRLIRYYDAPVSTNCLFNSATHEVANLARCALNRGPIINLKIMDARLPNGIIFT